MLVRVQQSRARHELFTYNISELTSRVHVDIRRKMHLSWFNTWRSNNKHKVFTAAVRDCRNLAVRTISCNLICIKLKLRWHSTTTTTSEEPVRKIFMKRRRVVVNSKECLSRDIIGQASVAYSSIGKHLARSKAKTVSSEAALPTF